MLHESTSRTAPTHTARRGAAATSGGATIPRWHEWLNREYCPSLDAHARDVAQRFTHRQAVKYLLAARPTGQTQAFNASAFWSGNGGRNRAILLVALLTREGTITELVNQDGAPRLLPDVSKLYTFLREWGIDYKAFDPPPRIDAIGLDHRIVRGRLEHHAGAYHLRAGARRLPLTYQPWGEWTLASDPGPDVPLATAQHAARLAGHASDALTLHHACLHHSGHGLANLALPRTALDDILGADHVEAAMILSNRCRCQYWDDQNRRCGLEARRPTIPVTCPDYTPLEVAWSASQSEPVRQALASPAASPDVPATSRRSAPAPSARPLE